MYYTKKISDHEGDLKKIWKIIKEIRGKHKNDIKPLFIINNERILNRRIIANEFNKYFISIANTMNEKVQESKGISLAEINNIR